MRPWASLFPPSRDPHEKDRQTDRQTDSQTGENAWKRFTTKTPLGVVHRETESVKGVHFYKNYKETKSSKCCKKKTAILSGGQNNASPPEDVPVLTPETTSTLGYVAKGGFDCRWS